MGVDDRGSPLDDLVAAARLGSGDAFAALWATLSPVVNGYVRGRGACDPEDVTSEVFLAAFKQIDAFQGDGADFRRWLFTIAHHRAVDAIRRQQHRIVERPYDTECDARRVASAESDAMDSLGHADALALLDRLPDDQRDVLTLRLIADLPVADAARVLDRSPEAVRQLQRRAIGRLRRELASARADRAVTPTRSRTIAEV